MSDGGVLNGQLANETNFNQAFLPRNGTQSDTVAKIDFVNNDVASGAHVLNIQRNINSIASALGITPNQAHDLLITWANTIVGVANSSAKDKIEAVVERFSGTTGHIHDGTDGNAPKVDASDLASFNNLWGEWQSISAVVNGGSLDLSIPFAGKIPGGDASNVGVITVMPFNKGYIIDQSTQTIIEDAEGQRIYFRLTESSGTWTATFYTNEGGVETPYSFSSPVTVDLFYLEVFTSATRPTIPSDPSQFGTLDITADVLDATQLLKGKVNLQNAASADIAIAGTIGTPNGRVANADHTHQGVHALKIFGSVGSAFGDVELEAGDNVEITWDAGKIKIKSAGGVAFQETPVGVTNGVNAVFGPLTYLPSTVNSVLVFIDYVAVPLSGYSISGSTLTFNAGWIPAAGQTVYVYYITSGLPSLPSLTGTFKIEYITLSPADILAKQISLALTPVAPNEVSLDFYGGSIGWVGVDFTVVGNLLQWNGLGMDGFVAAGDQIRISYVS